MAGKKKSGGYRAEIKKAMAGIEKAAKDLHLHIRKLKQTGGGPLIGGSIVYGKPHKKTYGKASKKKH